ncbi:MAG: hypothetical protein QF519_06010, partial [Candidatus Poseidoniia archaeon]|nr:hypothetical protein [Candidatus Poseidoniia archaeon]
MLTSFVAPAFNGPNLVANAAAEEGATEIKIGLLSPITGPIAVYAPGFSDAANVAIAELNANQTDGFNFTLVVGDSGCDGTTA